MRSYPETPPGWTELRRRRIGPFTTHVTYRRGDGGTAEWRSRAHRKHASLLSRGGRSGWWAPRHASWWIAVLFLGSLLFTAAAALQYLETINADRGSARVGARRRLRVLSFEPDRIDWWACAVQLGGTLLFNASTYDALRSGLSTPQENRLIWAPDVFVSVHSCSTTRRANRRR